VSPRAELGRYFRADKPTTANDHDLHDEPFRVAFDWCVVSVVCDRDVVPSIA
jgi:hypothetical protein